MKKVICPVCGKPVIGVQSKYGVRHECCGLWGYDGRHLVPALTHQMRQAAHSVFDRMWQSRQMSRTDAYKWMQKAMDLPPEKCHIALMDEDTARKLIDKVHGR